MNKIINSNDNQFCQQFKLQQNGQLIYQLKMINNGRMLKKKNYKEEEHFNQLHSFSVYAPASPMSPARKFQVYYKRYKKQKETENVYSLIHGKGAAESDPAVQPKYSEDRTLELISFDGDIGFLKKYLRKIGKIRQYDTGEGLYKGERIFTAMCVFKFQFDLVKCFRDEFLQAKMDQQCLTNAKTITEDDREEERCALIEKHMGKQLGQKISKLKEMQADGFQLVTDIYGQYRMDYEANQKFVQNLPQIKKQKKKEKKEKRLREQLESEGK